MRTIRALFGVMLLVGIILGLGYNYYKAHPSKSADTTALQLPPEKCLTPCSMKIDRPVRIFWDDPIWVVYSGVKDTVRYPARGTATPPEDVEKGMASFGSDNPRSPRVWITKYNIIIARGR